MISFPCPSCQRPLEVADKLAGQDFRCPMCAATLTVPASKASEPGETAITRPQAPTWPVPPPASTAITDQPAAERGPASWPAGSARDIVLDPSVAAAGWTSVCTGLRLLQISVVIKVGILATYLLALASMLQAAGTLESRDLHATVVVAVVVAVILDLAGAIFMIQVPEHSGCKPYAVTILICQGTMMAAALLIYAGRPGTAIAPAQLLSGATGLIMLIVLLVFLHKIGSYFGSRELRRQVIRFAISYVTGVIGAGAFMVIGIWRIASATRSTTVGVFLVCLIGMGAIMVLLVMQANLYSLARDVIRRRTSDPAKES